MEGKKTLRLWSLAWGNCVAAAGTGEREARCFVVLVGVGWGIRGERVRSEHAPRERDSTHGGEASREKVTSDE